MVVHDHAGVTLHHGDVRACLAELAPESVQAVVTSPPYWGLRDYGLPPSIWGGAAACDHHWGGGRTVHKGGTSSTDRVATAGRAAPAERDRLSRDRIVGDAPLFLATP